MKNDEAIEATNLTTQEISSEFKEGDEIAHYDDYGYDENGNSMYRMAHESLLLKRNGKVIKSVCVRMS